MKKNLISFAILVISLSWSVFSFAQEKDELTYRISTLKEGITKLGAVQTVAIFLNGNDPLLTRIVEDSISIDLANTGFTISSRELLEKIVGEKLAKKRKAPTGGTMSALEVGETVGADAILTGTVIFKSGMVDSILVQVASFQMIDVGSGKTLLGILFEAEKGAALSEISRNLNNIIEKKME